MVKRLTRCSHCERSFKVEESNAGRRARCGKCGETFVIIFDATSAKDEAERKVIERAEAVADQVLKRGAVAKPKPATPAPAASAPKSEPKAKTPPPASATPAKAKTPETPKTKEAPKASDAPTSKSPAKDSAKDAAPAAKEMGA
ncbi:MAG: MJ0042-type zinc finger domain-containing protein, partial [Planctomycetota bacterium]